MIFRTWMAEAAVVATVLAAMAAVGGRAVDWLGAVAVLLSFMHAQVSDRMAEDQGAMPVASVTCFRWSVRYFAAKELCWLAFFVATGAWAPLAGVFLFLAYPIWRRAYRRRWTLA